MENQAGFFEADVTPKRPVFLAGFPSRRNLSDGVDDPLFLRIMALADGRDRRAVLVTSDLLKFPKDLTWRTKRWAERALRLPSSSLILNTSHTHSAPALFYQECYPHWALDTAYLRELEMTIRRGIRQALEGLRPMRIRMGLHQAHFGVSRRSPDPQRPGKVKMAPNPNGYHDPDLPILTFHDPASDKLVALFYTYACHPTSKAANLVSADYPGQVSRSLKKILGQDVLTLFAQGAGGSIMPRFLCRSEQDKAAYAAAWEAVAKDIVAFARSDRMKDLNLCLSSGEREFAIPYDLREMASEEQLTLCADPAEPPVDRVFWGANREILRLWAGGILEKIRTKSLPEGFTMHVTRLALDPALQIIALSGEVTADIGRLVKDAERGRRTIFLGYCSYTDAYIPTAAMIPEEGHEGKSSMYYHMRPAPFVKDIDRIILHEIAATPCA
jgi:hypothetical protein